MTWPWPGPAGLEQPAHHAEGQQHAAAAEVAHQVERRHRRARPARPIIARVPRQGDVVDVVAGRWGVGPVLAPAGHAPVDQLGVAGQALVGPDAEPLGDAGPEPSISASACSTRRSTASRPSGA